MTELDLDALAEPWDEDKTEFKPVLVLDAKTFRPKPWYDIPTVDRNDDYEGIRLGGEWGYRHVWCRRGKWMQIARRVPAAIGTFADGTAVPYTTELGKVYFTEDVSIPCLYWRFPQNVWMSYGPMEYMTQRAAVARAQGRVVIGGYGMGWLSEKVAAKPEVEITITVEKDSELCMFARWERKLPERSRILQGDIYDYMERTGCYRAGDDDDTIYLLDIWRGYDDVHKDEKFAAWKRKLGSRLWGWGED